jgi:tryptophan synthase beta chain
MTTRPGYFGRYGGRFVPEVLVPALLELEAAYAEVQADSAFQAELSRLQKSFTGRPTPVYYAENLSRYLSGAQIYFKREDLTHTGAHKINNALGQALIARRLGKRRIVAETGAGQHGLASAAVAAKLGLECVVYMGAVDVVRQKPNVLWMRLMGAEVRPVEAGTQTLKDAISEALRDWVTNLEHSHYLLGSALGPHPYPTIVRDFQSVIGREAKAQMLELTGRLPDYLVACVGGGSNSIGLFHPFLVETGVKMVGVEAAGKGLESGAHAARFGTPEGQLGILHGAKTYVLTDSDGQIKDTHSLSAGLDYAAVGPEHSYLREIGRVEYTSATDAEAIAAFRLVSRLEGMIPALESSHGLAHAIKLAPTLNPEQIILVNLSGRGDKDIFNISQALGLEVQASPTEWDLPEISL